MSVKPLTLGQPHHVSGKGSDELAFLCTIQLESVREDPLKERVGGVVSSREFLKSLYRETPNRLKRIVNITTSNAEDPVLDPRLMLFLRLDQALELLRACRDLRERLIVRYFLFNGLSPMELSNACIEHLDPLSCTLFLPRRHWKRNCLTDIDPETVRLQIMYSGDLREGPLIRSRTGGHLDEVTLWTIVKEIALRTDIPGKEAISPLVLKRTFAREWLLSGGNLGSLQKQFSHKHLWSTAHYLRFVMEDVKPNHARLLKRAALEGER